MTVPTEPIGSIPRSAQLIDAGQDLAVGRITAGDYARLADAAVRETIGQFEATGSPEEIGQWTHPFEEGGANTPRCVPSSSQKDPEGFVVCKPVAQAAAVTVSPHSVRRSMSFRPSVIWPSTSGA